MQCKDAESASFGVAGKIDEHVNPVRPDLLRCLGVANARNLSPRIDVQPELCCNRVVVVTGVRVAIVLEMRGVMSFNNRSQKQCDGMWTIIGGNVTDAQLSIRIGCIAPSRVRGPDSPGNQCSHSEVLA